MQFFSQNFSKNAQKRLFLLFFQQKFACNAENLAKIGAKQCFGRARKINLVDLKIKKVIKIFEFFLKIPPPPLEKILDPPPDLSTILLETSYYIRFFLVSSQVF